MDLEYIKQKVAKIDAKKDDDEGAHNMEDALHKEFIAFVAKVGSPELSAMAREVLKTGEINFCRWCA